MSAGSYVGGVIGYINVSTPPGTIINSYNTGEIKAESGSSQYIGAVIGKNDSPSHYEINNNYTLNDVAALSRYDISKTATEMKSASFAQLLSSNYWTIVEGKNDGYPILKWEM